MIWLKKEKPGNGPSEPKEVDPFAVWAALNGLTAKGQQLNTYQTYLQNNFPKIQYDSYGIELPLSAVQQDFANRLIAILKDPIQRGRDLLLSGELDNDEAKALAGGAPAAYAFLSKQALHEMIAAKPPLPEWSENVLSILFAKNAAMVFEEAKEPSTKGPNGTPTKPVANPTPSEQMDNKKI